MARPPLETVALSQALLPTVDWHGDVGRAAQQDVLTLLVAALELSHTVTA